MTTDDREVLHQGKLLDELAKELHSDYLSDLRLPANRLSLIPLLNRMEPSLYSIKDWNDAISYILGERRGFETQRDARKYLISQILSNGN